MTLPIDTQPIPMRGGLKRQIFRKLGSLFALVLGFGLLWAAEEPVISEFAKDLEEIRVALAQGNAPLALDRARVAAKKHPENPRAHYALGQLAMQQRNDAEALAAMDRAIKLLPSAADIYQDRGWLRLRMGQAAEAVEDFDRFLEIIPGRGPYHWQRGIALYYAGDFAAGKAQFESHQGVNPQDVENAVWHFLCHVPLADVQQAREAWLRVAGDHRVPMMQVQKMFLGDMTPEEVLKVCEDGAPGAGELKNRLFYAHLYISLYQHALGNKEKAKHHANLAVGEFFEPHLMGDVALAHARHLGIQSSTGKGEGKP